MAEIELVLDGQPLRVPFDKLVMAGYTGRNQAEVQAHIDELRTQGIPAPDHIPTLYACSPHLLSTGESITVLGDRTSGEAEFVLIPHREELLVGVGSDHTDRALEETDIPRAKQLCAKVVSQEVWRLSAVQDHWDELVLRSWTVDGNQETLYQEGPLARMMTPDDILAYLREHAAQSVDGAILFSGTLAVLNGHFRPAAGFRASLEDPRSGRRLTCAYRVQVMDYLRN